MTEQMQFRFEKLGLLASKCNPYPENYPITHELELAKTLPDGEGDVSVAGRVILVRRLGKLTFVTLSNVHTTFQLMLKEDIVGETDYRLFHSTVDIGDFIGADGHIFTTQTGEKTLRVSKFAFLGKALRPLPEKYHGLVDVEERYRRRYLDLIANRDTADRFIVRSKIIHYIREYLHDSGYYEIETPVLCNKASGALARPFVTHHNSLDMDVYLRISPETYLKRAIIGGFEKVFEVARNFRNEGNDPLHVQDFTMIEGYAAYRDFKYNMKFCHDMICHVIDKVFGTPVISIFGEMVDFSQEFSVVTFRELVLQHSGIDIEKYTDPEELLKVIERNNIALEFDGDITKVGYGTLVDQLYKKVSRPKVNVPTYLIEHPIQLSPLARANDTKKGITDRFQLIINGSEIINGYSELVDPVEQRRRLDAQAALRKRGDTEAMMSDDDYVNAMEYGMPPISGWGWGMDTFLRVITSSDNIRDVIMFPLLRP